MKQLRVKYKDYCFGRMVNYLAKRLKEDNIDPGYFIVPVYNNNAEFSGSDAVDTAKRCRHDVVDMHRHLFFPFCAKDEDNIAGFVVHHDGDELVFDAAIAGHADWMSPVTRGATKCCDVKMMKFLKCFLRRNGTKEHTTVDPGQYYCGFDDSM